jgi:glycosyltransferase involved in cell wall biosynthesis/predicted O-methyltransferase YrrM
MALRQQRITIYSDDPGEGGVAVYNSRLAAGLAGLGYDVSIAQSEPDSQALVNSRPLIPHFWIPFHTRHDPQRNLTDTEAAASVLRSARPDIVVFTNCAPVSQVAATIAAAELGIPYVIVEGFVAPPGPLLPHQAWMLHYQRLLYEKARAVIAVSQENLDLLRAHYGLHPRKGEVIHYGRPEEFFQPRNSTVRKERRATLHIPQDAIVCLTSARFAEVKGFDHQIDAMQLLRGRPVWERLHFLWAGDGPFHEHYARRLAAENLADHVTMPGHVEDIAGLLDTGDIFVLPSHHEGMPLSIMEAMAKGLAVAASAVSGIPEQLGKTGRLLPDPKVDPERTATVLAEAIEGWANEPATLLAEGEACAARARSMFQEIRMIRQMVSVIERAGLPTGDYVSPGLEMIRLDEHFPHLAVASKATLSWQYLRDEIPHTFYIDRRVPGTGFLNRDEAILLYNIARLFHGRAGLEVGCWLGWSAAHVAAAGVILDVIDPVLGNPSFRDSVAASLASAGLSYLVTLHAASSPAAIDDLGRAGKRWSFIFVDGNHDAPYPLFDTATAIEYAEPDAAVVFHDLASPDVAQALEYLACRGWKTRIYHTAQIMGIAWRGDVTPPLHLEDPAVSWPVAKHLRRFAPSL